MTTFRRVRGADGTTVAVYEHGEQHSPTIVAVHGYPDNHTVWDAVVPLLADRFHVVTYDVRGTGESAKPADRASYRIPHLLADLGAVLDAVSPEQQVHLLAHDWGSVQCWAALTDRALKGRIRSFTSISGPSLDHVGAWLRQAHRHPGAALRQLLESYYVALFQVPALPEALWRTGPADLVLRMTSTVGHTSHTANARPSRQLADKINGLELYRANIGRRLRRPEPERTDIPVQVIAPRGDAFLSPTVQTQAPAPYVSDLRTHVVAGGHWIVTDQPDLIARLTSEFIQDVAALS